MSTRAQENTSAASRQRLAARADALRKVRHFFDQRDLIEIDVPALTPYASIDAYIDLIETKEGHFLHSSPEYALKRHLCRGSGDCYYLGHVFRKEEEGRLHHCEFTMIEWYRTQTTESFFLDEACELLQLFLGPLPYEILNYNTAWETYVDDALILDGMEGWSEEEKIHYQWATQVEPHLGQECMTVITNFPPQQAALAQTHLVDGTLKARRYEIYHRGIELANGFHELCDPQEHVRRFQESNETRIKLGKSTYPMDQTFINALKSGHFPENTYGMAAGFDRLLMLQEAATHLSEILA